MKMKIGIIILAAVSVGLLIALLATKKAADAQHTTDTDAIILFSNDLVKAHANIDDLNQVNLELTNDLAASRDAFVTISNNLTGSLLDTSNNLTHTEALLQNVQDQVTNLNSRIADLEAQNQALDERAATLTNTIAMLDAQITETQQKLAVSETNNDFLTAQLQTQLALKAELEHKFADLDTVRAQVKKLRDEAFVAQRLQWMSNGNNNASTPPKGAEMLMQHSPASKIAATNPPPHYDLNVEVGSDGSVHVITPATNAPPQP
jgi:chromosome segregation ATPase